MESIARNSPLENALFTARQGFRVFPCRPGEKKPLTGLMWVQQATQDENHIWQWWTDQPEANVGVVADDWVILDIDCKPGEPSGFDTLAHLLPQLPPTFTVSTPSGGKHLYFSKPTPEWQPTVRRGSGFDVQTGNAYVLAPPSCLGPRWMGRGYAVIDPSPPAALPSELAEFLSAAPEREPGEVVDLPPLLGQDAVPVPDASGWPEKLRKWWGQGDASGYENDRSAAVQSLAAHLYMAGYDDQQVMGVLWFQGWNHEVAMDPQHNSGQTEARALQWLWLGCAKVRGLRRPSPDEVFQTLSQTTEGESADALYVRLYEQVTALKTPNNPETLRVLSEVLAAAQVLPEPARALLATTIGDANLGMTRKQAENMLFPKRGRLKAPAGEGESGEWGLAKITDHIWIGHLARFYNIKSGKFLTREGFKGQYAHMVEEDQSAEDLVNVYLRQEKVKVEALTFRPELNPGPMMEDAELKWNIGAPLALEPLEGDWGPYLDLFQHMGIADAERDHMLDYMAWMVQRPGERIRHALVVGGRGTGTGKDTLFMPLKAILGKRYTHELKGRNLSARFNSYLLNKRLIVVQEAHQEDPRAARSLENHLKPLFTSDEIEVEPKGVDMFMVRNYAHWVITTNESHPLHISAGDRRYAMVKVSLEFESHESRARWAPYWRQLYAWMGGGGNRMILAELLRRDLSRFDPNMAPLVTTWHEQIEYASLTEGEAMVRDALEDEAGVLGLPFFTLENAWSSVRIAFPHVMSHGRPISQHEVGLALKRFGYENKRIRFQIDGKRDQPRVWMKGGMPMDPKEAWEMYVEKVKACEDLSGSNVVPFPGPEGV